MTNVPPLEPSEPKLGAVQQRGIPPISPALGAISAAGAPLAAAYLPAAEGHQVSDVTQVDVGSYLTMNLKQLKQARATIAASASATILGAVAPAKEKELQALDHLIRIRAGNDAYQSETIKDESPEEIADLLHSLVAVGRENLREMGSVIDATGLAFSLTNIDPAKKAAVFEALFTPGRKYSQGELDSLKSSIPSFEAFISEALMEASTRPSVGMLQALRNFQTLCAPSSSLLEESESAIQKVSGGIEEKGSRVLSPTEELAQKREELPRRIGVGWGLLRFFRLAISAGSQQAREAAVGILDSLERISHAPGPRTKVETKAIDTEIERLRQDKIFQEILQSNPVLKERFTRLCGDLLPPPSGRVPVFLQIEKPGETLSQEMGKVGRFLARIGLLGQVRPQRAQQACAVVLSRIERAVQALPLVHVAGLGSAAEKVVSAWTSLESDHNFIALLQSNTLLREKWAAMKKELQEQLRQKITQEQGVSATLKMQLLLQLRHLEGSIDEKALVDILNLLSDEIRLASQNGNELKGIIKTLEQLASLDPAIADRLKPLEQEARLQWVTFSRQENAYKAVDLCLAQLGQLVEKAESGGVLGIYTKEIASLQREVCAYYPKRLHMCEALALKCFIKTCELALAKAATPREKIACCKNLMKQRKELLLQDAASKKVIQDLVSEIIKTALEVEGLSPAECAELRKDLSSLQPEGGQTHFCLNIDQNKEIEICKQRLTVLAAPKGPLLVNQALDLAFAVSFLTKNAPDIAAKVQNITEVKREVSLTLEQQLSQVEPPDDRAAIVRVLSWDPRATISDVAILIRWRDRMPQELINAFPERTKGLVKPGLRCAEAILEFMNSMQLPDHLSPEDFTTIENFFEQLNDLDLVSDLISLDPQSPTNFRLKQQVAERMIWNHRPLEGDLPKVGAIGLWYMHQLAVAEADQQSLGIPTPEGETDLRTIPHIELPEAFKHIDSTHLVDKGGMELQTAYVSSRMVSKSMMRHLTRDQADVAIGRKAAPGSGDGRTPEYLVNNGDQVEGVFCTEFSIGEADASIFHQHAIESYPEGKVRPVLVARNLQPDTERPSFGISREGTIPVFLWLAALGDEEVVGEPKPKGFTEPTPEEMRGWTEEQRQAYDDMRLRHEVYHLYPNHIRPAKSAVSLDNILSMDRANFLMEDLIREGATPEQILTTLNGKYIAVEGRLVSLAVYFTTAVIQTRNIHAMGEACGPYTCPLMPPSIFALRFQDPTFHNRLQCLSYQFIGPEKFEHLAVLAPNTYQDENLLGLYQKVFQHKKGTEVIPLRNLYGAVGTNGYKQKLNESFIVGTLIQPTNTDALGDNFNNEKGSGSLEAAVGHHVETGFDPKTPSRMEIVQYV